MAAMIGPTWNSIYFQNITPCCLPGEITSNHHLLTTHDTVPTDEKLVQHRGNSLEDDQVAEASDDVEHLAAEEEVMDAKP